MSEPKVHVIYHANCYDGFGAAWVFRAKYPDAAFHAASYGDPIPADIEPVDTVFIADFSFPRDQMVALKEQCYYLQVLDHHKSAQANCEGLDFCLFDMERSGAGMSWDFCFPGRPRPTIINYVEDRDLWKFKLPQAHDISAYISSFERDFKIWDALSDALEYEFEVCVGAGVSIQRYYKQKVAEINEQFRWEMIGEHLVPVVNCPYSYGSSCAGDLATKFPEAAFAAYYFDRGDGEQQWGLRSRGAGGADVSEVAKQFGGGGHFHAAGFVKGKATR